MLSKFIELIEKSYTYHRFKYKVTYDNGRIAIEAPFLILFIPDFRIDNILHFHLYIDGRTLKGKLDLTKLEKLDTIDTMHDVEHCIEFIGGLEK